MTSKQNGKDSVREEILKKIRLNKPRIEMEVKEMKKKIERYEKDIKK